MTMSQCLISPNWLMMNKGNNMKAILVAVALMFGMSVAVASDKAAAEKGKPAAEKKADTAKK